MESSSENLERYVEYLIDCDFCETFYNYLDIHIAAHIYFVKMLTCIKNKKLYKYYCSLYLHNLFKSNIINVINFLNNTSIKYRLKLIEENISSYYESPSDFNYYCRYNLLKNLSLEKKYYTGSRDEVHNYKFMLTLAEKNDLKFDQWILRNFYFQKIDFMTLMLLSKNKNIYLLSNNLPYKSYHYHSFMSRLILSNRLSKLFVNYFDIDEIQFKSIFEFMHEHKIKINLHLFVVFLLRKDRSDNIWKIFFDHVNASLMSGLSFITSSEINLVKQILKKYKKDNIIDILGYSNLFTYEYRWKYSRWK